MTEGEVIDVFIKAAEVDKKLPNTAKPATLKAINHGYVHDYADINGWDSADKEALRWDWLDPAKLRNTTNDMGLWYAAMELIKLVPSESQRRSLWAWARSEAGGQPFAKWCKNIEGVSRQLGDWRRKTAISNIARTFASKTLLRNDLPPEEGFTNQAENRDSKPNIEVFRTPGAKPMACHFDTDLAGFDWANKQNERRRQREAKRKQAA